VVESAARRCLGVPFTEGETRRWLFLRAAEWTNWPSFLSQAVLPVMFIFYKWFFVVAAVFFLDVIWAAIRYKYVNVTAATYAVFIVSFCKWPATVGSAIYLFAHHSYLAGILAIAWPLGLCGIVGVPGKVGTVELLFAQKIGYVR
jgi:hypothetical protein